MKHKKVWIAVAVLLLIGLAVFFFSAVRIPIRAQVEVDSNGNTCRLSDEDAEQISGIFSGKELYFDNPACGFDKDSLAIRVGGATFLPGLDNCGTVEYGMLFFTLSDAETSTVHNILAKYGIRCFPRGY